ncbi:MAG: Ig-like domain-containing protein [Verrucomicrobiota bacterium]
MNLEALIRQTLRAGILAAMCLFSGNTAFAWPDLVLTKTGPASAAVGDTVSYTITYTNKGAISAASVVLTDLLPSELSPLTNTLGTGSNYNNRITWNLGSVAVNKGGKITFQALVTPAAVPGRNVTNFASIYTPTAESNTNNNTAKAVTCILAPACTAPALSPISNQAACPGGNAVFTASVTAGTAPVSLQWYRNLAPLAGQTNSSLALSSVSAADAGLYQLIATNACGRATNSAVLTVNTPVTITTPPADQSVCPGATAVFSVAASGSALKYQWYFANSALANQTNAVLSVPQVTAASAGNYGVTVSDACGNSLSNSASLTVLAPVLVTVPPANQTVLAGSNATFTIGVTGSHAAVQWIFNAQTVGTGTTLSLSAVTTNQAGVYTAIATGDCGAALTNSATLTVLVPVTIVTPPADQAACPAGSAVFSVSATGTALNYQWLADTNTLASETNSTLVLTNVAASDAGIYRVIVSGAAGLPSTNSAVLTVNSPFVVVTPPGNQTQCAGGSAVFQVAATGSDVTYQWYRGSLSLDGETNAVLMLDGLTQNDAGIYSVVVGSLCGTVTNSAVLTVNPATAATPLVSLTNCPGTTAVFSTVASGTGPFTYQWFKNGTLLAATGPVLQLNAVTALDAAAYTVIVGGACGNVTNTASLTVLAAVAATPLVSQTNCPGTTAAFSTTASGTGPITYQWYRNSQALDGQTANVLVLTNLSETDTASYSVLVAGACGSVSNSAVLAVKQPVAATALAGQTNCPGTTAVFSTVASGTGPITYQWFENSTLISGQSGPTLTLPNVSATSAAAYSVIVSSACEARRNSAALVVNSPVNATALLSQTNCTGSTAVFSTVASGSGPIAYQWFHNDNLLTGQTAASLVLPSLAISDAGTYSVVVSGACASVTNAATLTVNQSVAATPLAGQTNCPGTTAVFSTVASGTGPLTYQWFKNSTLISGQSGPVLTLPNVSATNAGTYSVIVSGACGSVTNSAALVVNVPVTLTALAGQTNCPGTTALFVTSASGTGPITYQWFKNGVLLPQNSGPAFRILSVTTNDTGLYSVVATGACGSATNSAWLMVNVPVTASPLPSLVRNPGSTAVFSTAATGSGPLTFVWKQNGTVLPNQTTATLTLTNVNSSMDGTYTVEVTGPCNTATQSGSLHVNEPPVVGIFTPTNGAVFLAPASFIVAANATDPDGTVTNVAFLNGTNVYWQTAGGNPYASSATNLAAGSYTFRAIATDDGGLSSTSAPVTISVITNPPLTIVSSMHLNLQTGLFEQQVRVSNPTPSTFTAIRILVYGITNPITVYNATSKTNGIPYVQSNLPILPGGYADLTIEYYVPLNAKTPNPTLIAQVVAADSGGIATGAGIPQPITRGVMLPDGFMVEFVTVTNAHYQVEYSSNLVDWLAAVPTITGNGTSIQWIDNGPPKTVTSPLAEPRRFYRVYLLQP